MVDRWPLWRTVREAVCALAIACGLSGAITTTANASASCAAVINGAFNFTHPALDRGNSAILTDWFVGDTITLTIVDALGSTHSDGFFHGATFTSGAFGALDQVSVPANGTATVSHTVVPADLINGIAIDPENNDSITATATCVKVPTSTVLAVVPNPSTFGQSVTLTATVSSSGGTPDGVVVFKDGATNLGQGTLAGGVATLNIATLDVGSHTLTAVYHGNFTFLTSASSPVTQVINKAATSTGLAAAPNPSTSGQTVTLTATVTSTGGTPAGIVAFKEGLTNLGNATLVGNTASITISTLALGSHSLTAVYHGNFQFATSTSPVVAQVVKTVTSTALASSPNPSASGQTVTLTATVTSSSGTPAGFVAFKNGTVSLGTANLAGNTATFTTAALSVGSHSLTAVYHGNFQFATSASPAVAQVVKPATSTALASSPNPSTSGQTVTLTATVTSTGGTPAGLVAFKNGAVSLGTANLAGNTATFTTAALTVGSHSLTAVYHGNSQFATSSSSVVAQVVTSATPSCALTTSPSTINSGQASTLSWVSKNAIGGRIESGIGAVPRSGSVVVSPSQTTTYHGTFTGTNGTANCDVTINQRPHLAILHSFLGGDNDGAQPFAGLIADRNGALYGTTSGGGTANRGTVFRLTPPPADGGSWTYAVLHKFGGDDDGSQPVGGLIADRNGALYGTTAKGGAANLGTVFKLTPQGSGGSQWTATTLHSFNGGSYGSRPVGGLIADQDGALYGTTLYGGAATGCDEACGTVFKLTQVPGTNRWRHIILHRFAPDNGDGSEPNGDLTAGQDGVLYGTTSKGGYANAGAVFRLLPPMSSRQGWTETVLYSFRSGGGDGALPRSRLIADEDGALYGTTRAGGASNGGAVFKLTPPSQRTTRWTESLLYSFAADGASPHAGVMLGADGALYATTRWGGASNNGTVVKLTQRAGGQGKWNASLLYNFQGGATGGAEPFADLMMDQGGALYGTTRVGGAKNLGTVFKLTH